MRGTSAGSRCPTEGERQTHHADRIHIGSCIGEMEGRGGRERRERQRGEEKERETDRQGKKKRGGSRRSFSF